jgi:hypothetical protein
VGANVEGRKKSKANASRWLKIESKANVERPTSNFERRMEEKGTLCAFKENEMETNERPTPADERRTSNGEERRAWDLEERLLEYSARIVRLVESLPKTRAGNHLGGQLLRSGTSPLLNHAEAESADSACSSCVITREGSASYKGNR